MKWSFLQPISNRQVRNFERHLLKKVSDSTKAVWRSLQLQQRAYSLDGRKLKIDTENMTYLVSDFCFGASTDCSCCPPASFSSDVSDPAGISWVPLCTTLQLEDNRKTLEFSCWNYNWDRVHYANFIQLRHSINKFLKPIQSWITKLQETISDCNVTLNRH